MFIQRLDGSWMSHPFWRRSFRVESAADLRTLRDSAVTHVWIDIDAGCDQAAGEPEAAVADAGAAPASPSESESDAAPPDGVEPGRPDGVAAVPSAATRRPVASPATGRHVGRGALHLPAEGDWERARRIRDQARDLVGRLFQDARAGLSLDTESARPVVDAVIDSVSNQPGTLVSLTRLKSKDDYTFMHSVAVCALMTALAIELRLDEAAIIDAATGGLLHDIGKMTVATDVLNNPGRLSDAEFAEVKRHTVEGHRLLVEAGTVSTVVLDVCRHHHERIDGTGYPDGLSEEQISLFARMGTVCDVYDAITSDRPYKKAWQPAVALQQMARWAPGAYDPQVFHAFVRSLGVYPNGSLVSLASGRIAVVVEQSQGRLLAPVVRAFHSADRRVAIPPVLIDLSESGCSERIIGRVDPADWGFGSLDHLWMSD